MDKTILIGMMVALIVVGAVFVSAQLSTGDVVEDSAPETTQPACDACGCGGSCGGSCGVPSCGCGR